VRLSGFDFSLPESLIALRPAPRRDHARLMVLRSDGGLEDRRFWHLPEYLRRGDILVLNKTRVLPVRLVGRREDGRPLDILLVRPLKGARWECLSRGKHTGRVSIGEGFWAFLTEGRTAELHYEGTLEEVLMRDGRMPLPPYIKRPSRAEDHQWYQTVYAREAGSIAAPTAGLHFTAGLLADIERKGVAVRYLTLHVGKGTFVPVRTEKVQEHRMEAEYFEIETSLLEEVSSRRGRLVAVGTTTTRALEGLLSGAKSTRGNGNGLVRGETDIFIRPGHAFRAVDALVTNFHLPRSTPLMLASALAGRERLLEAYRHAVEQSYRFFSYGDAMLIEKRTTA
jgi:S-adenosylmethionine:tRNA ribosyltransferase-isomerase